MAGALEKEANLCPCGEGPLDAGHGLHVVCVVCRDRVVKHVRRRFGPHRYSGRYAAEVEDVVQDCFRILLLPSGLGKFKADPERKRSDAFRAWLWRVVHNHCNNTAKSFRTCQGFHEQPEPDVAITPEQEFPGTRLRDEVERRWRGKGPKAESDATTPEQRFARTRLRDLNARAVAEVERCWRAKGPKRGERFDVVLPLVYEMEADTQRARERLGIDDGHLRVLKCKLAADIRRDVRKQVREDLRLEPETDAATIERAIDGEIEDLFQTAYPGGDPGFVFSKNAEPEPKSEPEHQGAQPEVTA